MIPKIIHYCWFGSKKMSELEFKCLESWKKFLPGFEFRLWNEINFDLEFCDFTKEAYRIGKYAFVSDVARVYALEKEGGIYLDTDMLLLKSLDDLLNFDFFLGEYKPEALNAAIIGSSSNNEILRIVLDHYKGLKFNFEKPKTIPEVFDELIWDLPSSQVKIFSPEYFYPLALENKEEDYHKYIVFGSYSVHLWNHSWKDEFSLLKEYKFLSSLGLLISHLFRFPNLYLKQDFLQKYWLYFKRFGKQYLHFHIKF
ncbi:MAG: glycosyltransferase [Algoriphagus sp.]|uniref:glycosyltransferase family 32 protein n=1 Tax=Algoriphagus sp. TaxID=1872435 RepID=UPI0027357EE1|nr:glycosyltransferase [Algoriphagus sp.]MDP3200382.1 glycosyltransferase [Algoriphagus sp.]